MVHVKLEQDAQTVGNTQLRACDEPRHEAPRQPQTPPFLAKPPPLLARYEAFLTAHHGVADPAQLALIAALQRVHDALVSANAPQAPTFLARFALHRPKPVAGRGLYIYGAVGRGKTALMDLFYEIAPAPKWRVHFYAFMREVHDRLHRLRAEQAGKGAAPRHLAQAFDAITPLAKEIAQRARLLCFDEFAVTNIADAMILSRLITAILDEGVIMVATSNVAPERLYEGGLNRALFLPFIAILNSRFERFELDSRKDYRLELGAGDKARQDGAPAKSFYAPDDETAKAALEAWFSALAPRFEERRATLTVFGRKWDIARARGAVAFCTFEELCAGEHGANDFLELCKSFHTLILSGVPKLGGAGREITRRFIMLIDALYDARVKMFWSAASDLDKLFEGMREAGNTNTEHFALARTRSRLIEMGGEAWLSAPPWGGHGMAET